MPDNIPILCMVCNQTLRGDAAYAQHMMTHGGSVATGKAIEQNIPKIPVGKDVPPSSDFMEVAKMMDNLLPTPPPAEKSEAKAPVKQEDKKLELRYQWVGNCKECHTPVRTIMVKTKTGDISVVAYCLTHNEVDQRIVPSLEVGFDRKKDLKEQNEFIDNFNKEQEVSLVEKNHQPHKRRKNISKQPGLQPSKEHGLAS